MVSVCFYFQIHQPLRLTQYSVFALRHHNRYFDSHKNEAIMKKVTHKCYLPANRLILDLINKTDGRFRVAYSMTGIVLEQLERFAREVIASFRQLVKQD